MPELFQKMLHYRNSLSENEDLSPSIISEFEAEYDRILETAKKEYADEPPGDYYREGYNLFLRLGKYKENELLFLHDKRIPSNNLCVKGWPGYIKGNRNRQLPCAAWKTSVISVTA